MSAVIKTTTPFVIQSVLITALDEVGAEPLLVSDVVMNSNSHRGGILLGDILTNRSDYYGLQHFRFIGDRWILRHDSSEMNGRITASQTTSKQYRKVGAFLQQVGQAYEIAYQQHIELLAEQERTRLEEERKKRVEATRQQAINKAKSQGYSVKEIRTDGQIQLVLTRTV